MAESVVDASEVVMEEELFFDDPPREAAPRRDELVREGEVLAGKYRVERIPGRNGLGVLVQVRHLELGQEVTLKFLVPDACMYPEFVQRFIREARAAVKVQGEHVARVTDVGRLASGAPYMVREFLRGPDLSEVLKVRGPLPVSEACDYIIQAAEAVAEGHVLGIAHRNLRPTTLVVTRRSDGAPLVKVFDFAAAEALHVEPFTKQSVSLVGSSALLASLPYLSPEQVRDPHSVDFRADVYGLGAILYELLSGLPPFEAESAPALLAMVAADFPVRLRTLRFGLPEPLEQAVMRCLAKSRDDRFATIAELSLALRPYASSESLSSIERIVRLARRGLRPPPIGEARVSSPAIPVASPLPSFDDARTTVSPFTFNEEPPLRATQPLASYTHRTRRRGDEDEPETRLFEPLPSAEPQPVPAISVRTRNSPPPLRVDASPVPPPVQARQTSRPPPLHDQSRESTPPSPEVQAHAGSAPVEPAVANTTILPPARSRSSISWGLSNSWGALEPESSKFPLKKLASIGVVAACAAFVVVVTVRGFRASAYASSAAQPVAAVAKGATGSPIVAPPPAVVPPPAPVVSAPIAAEAASAVVAPAAPAAALAAPAQPPVAVPPTAVAVPAKAAAPAPQARAAAPAPLPQIKRTTPASPVAPLVADEAPRAPAKVAAAAPARPKSKDLFSDPD